MDSFFFFLQEVLIAAKIVMLMVALGTCSHRFHLGVVAPFPEVISSLEEALWLLLVCFRTKYYSKWSVVVIYTLVTVFLFLTEPHFHLKSTPRFSTSRVLMKEVRNV